MARCGIWETREWGTMEKRTVKTVEKRLLDFFKVYRRMPTYSEMLAVLGVRSKSVVHFWISKLLKEGILEKDRGGFLRPVQQGFACPLSEKSRRGSRLPRRRSCGT